MAFFRPPRLQAEYFQRLIRQLTGSTKPGTVGLAVLSLIVVGVSSNACWGILVHLTTTNDAGFSWLMHVGSALTFPLLVGAIWFWARRAAETVRVSVLQDDEPPKVKALILFLSPPGDDTALIQEFVEQRLTGTISDALTRQKFQRAWRMPIEAIAYHLERLQQVVLIPSADLVKSDGKTVPGTYSEIPRFIELVKKLVLTITPKCQLRIESLHQFAAQSNLSAAVQVDYSKGVDFEKVKVLVESVELAYDLLRDLGIPSYEVLVDITGGQKVPTVAGSAVALAEGRRFQYVSTHDFRVRTYDVTYLP